MVTDNYIGFHWDNSVIMTIFAIILNIYECI